MKTFLLLVVLFVPVYLFGFSGTVYKITDGDTFKLTSDETTFEIIRLYGIDCPEDDQAYGESAADFLSGLIMDQTVEVTQMDIDLYNRVVGMVIVNGTNVNRAMIEAGYAWVYSTYCKESFCDEWKDLQNQAKKERTGLWKDKNPLAPWDVRRGIDKPHKRWLSWAIIGGITLFFWLIMKLRNRRRRKR